MTIGSGTGEDGRLRRAVELLRRHPGVLIVVPVLVLVVAGVLNRLSDDVGNDGSRDGAPVHQPPSRSAADQEEAASTPDTESNAGTDANADPDAPRRTGSTTTTLTPPDVARPRPPVDVDVPPDGSDPVEVGRWWAAAYVAYVGAEPGGELAQRLEPFTTPGLRQELASMPPGASYNEPTSIEGVTATEPAGRDNGDSQGRESLRVVVETPGALVVYDLVLELGPADWQVDEATRL